MTIFNQLLRAFFIAGISAGAVLLSTQAFCAEVSKETSVETVPAAEPKAAVRAKNPATGPKETLSLKSVELSRAKKASASKKQSTAEEMKIKTEARSVTGSVVSARPTSLIVEFAVSEESGGEEILIPLQKGVKFSGVKAAKELKFGDRVKVDYEVSYEDKAWEGEPAILSTKARSVTLVRSARPEGALYAQ